MENALLSVRNDGRQLDISINCNIEYAIINLRFAQGNIITQPISPMPTKRGVHMQKFHIDRNWLCNRSLSIFTDTYMYIHSAYAIYTYKTHSILLSSSSHVYIYIYVPCLFPILVLTSQTEFRYLLECTYSHWMKCKNLIFIHQFQFSCLAIAIQCSFSPSLFPSLYSERYPAFFLSAILTLSKCSHSDYTNFQSCYSKSMLFGLITGFGFISLDQRIFSNSVSEKGATQNRLNWLESELMNNIDYAKW